MVLGALVINGIFVKCRVERRFMNVVLRGLDAAGSIFLLLLLLVGTAACSVLKHRCGRKRDRTQACVGGVAGQLE